MGDPLCFEVLLGVLEHADIVAQRIVRPWAGPGHDGPFGGRAVLIFQIRHVPQLGRGSFGGEAPEFLETEIEAPGRIVQLAGDGGVITVMPEDGR